MAPPHMARGRWLLAAALVIAPLPAWAVEGPAEQEFRKQLQALALRVSAQQAQIDTQQRQITADQAEIAALKTVANGDLDVARGTGPGAQTTPPSQTVAGQSLAPPKPDIAEQAQAVPQGQGVLTPAGRTTFQSSITYVRSADNRLVFAGIELVPGLQIGSIQASTADRNAVIGAITIWHGFGHRLEGELMIPGLHRADGIHLSQVRDGTVTEGYNLRQSGLGDIEGAIRYQLNAPVTADAPIFVASLRVKSDTGISPYSISYDTFGIAQGLATGSGFWGIQPGITMLLPSDPAVIYGGVSYLYQVPRTIDRTINSILIGEVKPGGALAGNLGFGFSINPRFSFSLGYSHSVIFPTRTELNGSQQSSTTLQIGTLDFGMSYRLSPRQSVNFAFQFGVTQDAPDVAITIRMPYTF